MAGAGGNNGGGLCNRSITDFATSAAERIVSGGLGARGLGARGLGARRETRPLRFGAAAVGLRTPGLALGVGLGLGVGLALGVGLGFGAGSGFGAGLGVGFGLAATGFDALTCVAAAPTASTFRRACFAAFFAALNNLRACFSRAFADRTPSFAAAARAAAIAAAVLRRFIVAVVMVFRAKREIKIDEYRRLPGRTRHAPWGTRATRQHNHAPADSRGILRPASWARCRPIVHAP
jgi:hypothetical protein